MRNIGFDIYDFLKIYILVAYNKSTRLYYNKYNESNGYREDTLYKDMIKDVTGKFNINCCIIEDILTRLENRGLCVFKYRFIRYENEKIKPRYF